MGGLTKEKRESVHTSVRGLALSGEVGPQVVIRCRARGESWGGISWGGTRGGHRLRVTVGCGVVMMTGDVTGAVTAVVMWLVMVRVW